MIKLSPDLVFDKGRSPVAMRQRAQTHTTLHTHTHFPSDKPNYDPVRKPNSQECVCVLVLSEAEGSRTAGSNTNQQVNFHYLLALFILHTFTPSFVIPTNDCGMV